MKLHKARLIRDVDEYCNFMELHGITLRRKWKKTTVSKARKVVKRLMPRRTFEQMRAEIRAAGGDGWDNIEDPDKFIRELRGGE